MRNEIYFLKEEEEKEEFGFRYSFKMLLFVSWHVGMLLTYFFSHGVWFAFLVH